MGDTTFRASLEAKPVIPQPVVHAQHVEAVVAAPQKPVVQAKPEVIAAAVAAPPQKSVLIKKKEKSGDEIAVEEATVVIEDDEDMMEIVELLPPVEVATLHKPPRVMKLVQLDSSNVFFSSDGNLLEVELYEVTKGNNRIRARLYN
jgi:hypothetical protein